jgi:hypothetical protein
MANIYGSITELELLVERLAGLLRAKFGPRGLFQTSQVDPFNFVVEGRSLGRWLQDLWPDAGDWSGPQVSQAAIAALEKTRHNRKQALKETLAEKKQQHQKRQQELSDTRNRLADELRQAQERLSRAHTVMEPLQEGLAQAGERLALHQAEAQRIHSWLNGISPCGLTGFADGEGNPVSQVELQKNTRQLAQVGETVAWWQRRVKELEGRLEKAHAQVRAASLQRSEAKAQWRKAQPRWDQETNALKQAQEEIDQLKCQINPSERSLQRVQALGKMYGQLLGLAASLMDEVLCAPEAPTFQDPVNAVEDSLAQAKEAGRRFDRVGRLLHNLAQRLENDSSQVGGVLKQVRAVNREIKQLEQELSRQLAPILHPEENRLQTRLQAAAKISTLLAQVESLIPEAEQAQAKSDDLQRRLTIGQERGRRWQTAWREAGKAQRQQLDQARALVTEVKLAARQRRQLAEDLGEGLKALVQVLGALRPLDLVPGLAMAVAKITRPMWEATLLRVRSRELTGLIKPPAQANLAQPPLALKPHSSNLRRLKSSRVRLKRLMALADSARQWNQISSNPLIKDIRRPAEQVALGLSQSLSLLAAERAQSERDRQRKAKRLESLNHELTKQHDINTMAQNHLERVRQRNRKQHNKIKEYEVRLDRLQKEKYAVGELNKRLKAASQEMAGLNARLEHSQRMAQALKKKALERHRLYRKSRRSMERLDYWRQRALEQESQLRSARSELDRARREYGQASQQLNQATAERDQSLRQLAQERAARARQALDLLGGKALSVELAAAQSEAGRWATLAQNLALALAISGYTHETQTADLRDQVDRLSSEAARLRKQLEQISKGVDAPRPPAPSPTQTAPVGVRVTHLDPDQVYRLLDRLAGARKRLQKIGRSTLGHWALVAALSGGLVMVPPGTSSKATRTQSPLMAPKPVLERVVQDLPRGPRFSVPIMAAPVSGSMGNSKIDLNLLPLRTTGRPLPPEIKTQINRLARQAGLSPKVLIISARALYAGQAAVDSQDLRELADRARKLAQRHPLIFRELARQGLPPSASAVAALDPAPEKAQSLFLDRLYREYRSLNFSAEEALGALVANQRAAGALHKTWTQPVRYRGKVTPLTEIEKMNLPTFLERMGPYIRGRLDIFLRQRGMDYAGDLDRYVKNLAFDMYCAAKKFQVPVTFLLAIAHQESWYANVLGDANRSASPYQIYEPTRDLIRRSMREAGFVPPPAGVRLERHLTMATYMAAFHLRELMQEAYQPVAKGQPRINVNQVLRRYNGSTSYIHAVARRQKQLARFLARKG